MVLLVGDGSTDPKQYRSSSPVTRIPPFLATVDAWMGETAVDNRYVAVDGDDNLPDMMLGRLPVNSVDELIPILREALAQDVPAVIDCPVDYGENLRFSQKTGDLTCKI